MPKIQVVQVYNVVVNIHVHVQTNYCSGNDIVKAYRYHSGNHILVVIFDRR